MKFDTFIHKIVKNHQQIFRKDPCTHARARGVNVRARISSWQNMRAHVYASCARVFTRIFTKNYLTILYYLINKSLKSHKDRSFRLVKSIIIPTDTDICLKILPILILLHVWRLIAIPIGAWRLIPIQIQFTNIDADTTYRYRYW